MHFVTGDEWRCSTISYAIMYLMSPQPRVPGANWECRRRRLWASPFRMGREPMSCGRPSVHVPTGGTSLLRGRSPPMLHPEHAEQSPSRDRRVPLPAALVMRPAARRSPVRPASPLSARPPIRGFPEVAPCRLRHRRTGPIRSLRRRSPHERLCRCRIGKPPRSETHQPLSSGIA